MLQTALLLDFVMLLFIIDLFAVFDKDFALAEAFESFLKADSLRPVLSFSLAALKISTETRRNHDHRVSAAFSAAACRFVCYGKP
jgi:hypothetical protein